MTTDVQNLPWDHPDLGYAGDSKRAASYRKAQSRWRELQLHLPYGRAVGRNGEPGKYVGNMLAEPSDLQWLTPEIADFARRRMTPPHRKGDAAINDTRLYRNLLSSMPMCFNIFGQLDARRAAAAQLMGILLDIDVAEVTDIWVEYAPVEARAALNDRTAFDAWMTLTATDGTQKFLAIETKYTEPFSPKEHWQTSYQEATNSKAGWFLPDSDAIAKSTATNQLWRNVLLAQLTEQHGVNQGVGTGMAVVLCLNDDKHAQAAVDGLTPLMRHPIDRLRMVHLDRMVEVALQFSDLRDWAGEFRERYLRPVE